MNRRRESRSTILGGFFYCLALGGLSACAPSSPALVQTLQSVGKQISLSDDNFSSKSLPLDPQWRYLRAQINDGPGIVFVLGYVETSPSAPVEVWYSAKAEVIKLQDGRIVATQGLSLDWIRVRYDPVPVPWESVGPDISTSRRFHDELPRYRFGVVDAVQTQAWQQAPTTRWPLPSEVQQAKDLRWYKVIARESGGDAGVVSWFARGGYMGSPVIVYSEQCLSPTLCFRLHRLPTPEGRS